MIGNLSLLELFQGSATMVVLLVCSIITVAFAVERSLYFHRHASNAGQFMKKLAPKVASGDERGALDMCRSGKSAVARVMKQGITNWGMARDQLSQRMTTAIELEQVEMERFLNVLGTMSNIAPLLGLFGTVIGIIRAFAAIARTGSGGSAVVAMGVAEALTTTAAGIIVAVIATVFYNTFVRVIRSRIAQLEDAREEFFVQLEKQRPSQPAARPAPRAETPEPVYVEPAPQARTERPMTPAEILG
ncbi:hypothetical protein DRQ53_04605 [bacterium]|nr:MAG: hypothetical protein DRQ53_04605 [bacterium]RLA42579.1 MAG: hypothetical protein DRQ97_13820 [Gammaproteobacteria bacterium]